MYPSHGFNSYQLSASLLFSLPDTFIEGGGEKEFIFYFYFLKVYLFILRETKRAQVEKGQRERETENPKQAPH